MSLDERLPIHDAILRAISSEQATSRIDLAHTLHLARSTVSLRVGELIEDGILEEYADAHSRGGRKARLLRIRAQSATTLALDISGHHFHSALVDARGSYISRLKGNQRPASDPQIGTAQLISHMREHLEHSGIDAVSGICIGFPAPINSEGGCLEMSARMPTWNSHPVAAKISDAFSAPVRLENDANLAAWGEHHAHPELRHSITVKAGGGLGAGIVLNNALYVGATGAAGDISHVRHENYGSLPCSCGNNGCLATVASGDALRRQWREHTGEELPLPELIERAQQEDPLAVSFFRSAGEHVGHALCEAVGLLNPEAIFLTGSMSTLDIFQAAVRSALYAGCHPLATRSLRIEKASQEDASLRGAALMATELVTH